MNDRVLNLLPNHLHTGRPVPTYFLTGNPNDLEEEVTPLELLQADDVKGVPPHTLKLKVG